MSLDPRKLWERINLKRDYHQVFTTPEGDRVLRDMLRRSGVTHPKFSNDPMVTQANEELRRFVASIFRHVHSSMDKLPDYLEEELKRLEQEPKTDESTQ